MPNEKYLDLAGLQRYNNKLNAKYGEVQTTTDTVANVIDVPTSAKGLATLKQIGGMSYKCKNLFDVDNCTVASGITKTSNGISFTNASYDSSATSLGTLKNVFPNIKTGLSYVFTCTPTNAYNEFLYLLGSSTIWNFGSAHTFTQAELDSEVFAYGKGGQLCTLGSIMLNEGSTALPYEAYYEGIHDSAVTKVESVGANIWDEQWELGRFNVANGTMVSDSTRLRTKNPIDVENISVIYAKFTSGTDIDFNYGFWDSNDNYISGNDLTTSGTIQVPNNAKYMKFYMGSGYGTTYNHDICINVSNSAINGNYYPYKTYELAIPSAIRSITGYGWGVNENCYNYIDFTLNEFRQYVGRVDLGSLTGWALHSSVSHLFTCSLALNNVKVESNYTTANILCALYKSYNWNNVETANNQIAVSTDGSIRIYDESCDNETELQTKINGVYLYYELATPVITDVSSLLDEVHIPIEAGGTLELVNTYNNAVPVQVTFDNGLVDVVLTNHQHDIEQQKDIDELYKTKNRVLVFTGTGQNIKTVGGFSLDGAGDIPFPSGAYHAYQLTLYANGYQPVFRTNLIVSATGTGYSAGVLPKAEGLDILTRLSIEYNTDEYICQEIQPNASYWDGSQITVTCPNATAVQYLEQQTSIVVIDNTGTGIETIDTSNIGDDDTASYYFYLHEV